MKVLCFGSANLDHVYKVNHLTVPGETQGCLEYTVKCGGKGVNQAIAMSLAGNETYFAGIIGNDGSNFNHQTTWQGTGSNEYSLKKEYVGGVGVGAARWKTICG